MAANGINCEADKDFEDEEEVLLDKILMKQQDSIEARLLTRESRSMTKRVRSLTCSMIHFAVSFALDSRCQKQDH